MQKLLALLGAKNKEEFMALLMQFIKFGLVGVSNTAVSMAVYYIFLWISPDLYMLGMPSLRWSACGSDWKTTPILL